MPTDSSRCDYRTDAGLCQHKDAKNRPCWVDDGREDLCPRSQDFQADKLAQEEDCGER